jgi:hypothetical protein
MHVCMHAGMNTCMYTHAWALTSKKTPSVMFVCVLCVYMYMHHFTTDIHTYIHTYTHTHIQTYLLSPQATYVYSASLHYVYTYTQIHRQTRTKKYLLPFIRHLKNHICLLHVASLRIYIHPHIPTQTHTNTYLLPLIRHLKHHMFIARRLTTQLLGVRPNIKIAQMILICDSYKH